MSSNAGASDVAAPQSDQGPDWKKLEAKDILGRIQWKPGTDTVVVKEDNTPVTEDEEDNTPVTEDEVYHQHAWTYTMSIKGPGRDVSIRGTLKPLKRSAEEAGLPIHGPFTMVRDCDIMAAQIQEDAAVAAANQCELQDTQEFDTVLDEEAANGEASAEAAMGTPGSPGTPPSPTIPDTAAAERAEKEQPQPRTPRSVPPALEQLSECFGHCDGKGDFEGGKKNEPMAEIDQGKGKKNEPMAEIDTGKGKAKGKAAGAGKGAGAAVKKKVKSIAMKRPATTNTKK
eukprot:s3507_g5.t1